MHHFQEKTAVQQVEKEKDHLKAELVQLKNESTEKKAYIDAQQAEERKLLKIIQEADSERMRQKKQLEQVNKSKKIYNNSFISFAFNRFQ